MEKLFAKTIDYVVRILNSPITEIKIFDLLVIVGFIVLAFFFLKWFIKAIARNAKQGFKIATKPIKAGWKKYKHYRRHKKVCHVCKNPLHECTCRNNINVPYRIRVKKWKRTEKEIKLAKKTKKLEEKLRNASVKVIVRDKRHDHDHRGGRR